VLFSDSKDLSTLIGRLNQHPPQFFSVWKKKGKKKKPQYASGAVSLLRNRNGTQILHRRFHLRVRLIGVSLTGDCSLRGLCNTYHFQECFQSTPSVADYAYSFLPHGFDVLSAATRWV